MIPLSFRVVWNCPLLLSDRLIFCARWSGTVLPEEVFFFSFSPVRCDQIHKQRHRNGGMRSRDRRLWRNEAGVHVGCSLSGAERHRYGTNSGSLWHSAGSALMHWPLLTDFLLSVHLSKQLKRCQNLKKRPVPGPPGGAPALISGLRNQGHLSATPPWPWWACALLSSQRQKERAQPSRSALKPRTFIRVSGWSMEKSGNSTSQASSRPHRPNFHGSGFEIDVRKSVFRLWKFCDGLLASFIP